MIRTLFALCLSLITFQATALSCAAPDIVRSYVQARDSSDAYVVLRGDFTFRPINRKKAGARDLNPEDFTRRANFTGLALGKDRFSKAYSRQVRMVFQCLGPWCGNLQPGKDMIAFAKLGKNMPEIEVSPCGGTVFQRPEKADIDRLLLCHTRGICDAAHRR